MLKGYELVSGDERSQNYFWSSVTNQFTGIGNSHATRNSVTLAFPRLRCFIHRRVQHFRWLHNWASHCTRCYTAIITNKLYVWPRTYEGTHTRYVDCSLGPATPAASKHTKLYRSMLLVFIRHALLACVTYPHITTDGASFSKTPFQAPTPTCIVPHPEVRRDGSSYCGPTTYKGAYYRCLCMTAILPTRHKAVGA